MSLILYSCKAQIVARALPHHHSLAVLAKMVEGSLFPHYRLESMKEGPKSMDERSLSSISLPAPFTTSTRRASGAPKWIRRPVSQVTTWRSSSCESDIRMMQAWNLLNPNLWSTSRSITPMSPGSPRGRIQSTPTYETTFKKMVDQSALCTYTKWHRTVLVLKHRRGHTLDETGTA